MVGTRPRFDTLSGCLSACNGVRVSTSGSKVVLLFKSFVSDHRDAPAVHQPLRSATLSGRKLHGHTACSTCHGTCSHSPSGTGALLWRIAQRRAEHDELRIACAFCNRFREHREAHYEGKTVGPG